jgi:ABC-type branched-subunit amino acid transport system ATPase component
VVSPDGRNIGVAHENARLLETVGLTRVFGGVRAVDNLDFYVDKGEIVSLIGPNGAGKTTVFNVVSGIYPPTAGRILFKGQAIAGLKPDRVERKGISRTFQTLRLFANMTVLENVLVGFHSRLHSNLFGDIIKPPWVAKREREAVQEARALLAMLSPRLVARQDFRSADLAYADRRLLELARAMASQPDMLMLDEPTAGMNPSEAVEFMDHIRRIHAQGFTILLIEHNLSVVMGVSQRITVLDYGTKISEGTPDQVRRDERVIEAYLGRKAATA